MAGFYEFQLVLLTAVCIAVLLIERYVASSKKPSASAQKELVDDSLENGAVGNGSAGGVTGARAAATRALMRKYLIVYAIVMGADWLQGPYIYSLYRQQYGFSERVVSILFVTGFLSAALFSPLVGVWADQFGRRRICELFCVTYMLTCTLLLYPSMPLLFLSRALGGISGSILYSAFESWLVSASTASALHSEDLSSIMGRATLVNGFVATGAGIISNKLVEYNADNFRSPFIASGALLILAFFVIRGAWTENYGGAGAPSADDDIFQIKRLGSAWSIVTSDPVLLVLGLTQTIFEGSMYLFVFIWVPTLQEASLDPSSLPLGYIFSAFMVSMMLGSLLYTFITAHWHRPPPMVKHTRSASVVDAATPDTALILHAKLSSLVCAVSAMSFAACVHSAGSSGPFAEHLKFWAFCAFEACVGMYYPVQGMLRGSLVANEHRATVSALFRVPLNVFVVISLLTGVSSMRNLVLAACAIVLSISSITTAVVILPRIEVQPPADITNRSAVTNIMSYDPSLTDTKNPETGSSGIDGIAVNDEDNFEGIPTTDDHWGKVGAETFEHFQRGHTIWPSSRARKISDPYTDLENFPDQLEKFADDFGTFLHCFNEVAEFEDESVNNAITAFESDLRYWASSLKEYTGQFRYPGVKRYLHDLSSEVGDHLESISTAVSLFVEIGVPTIRSAQKYSTNSLRNLSTLATFFSAVTATTLQFSFEMRGTPITDSVNGFWFTAMVFSVAAAVNGLLGLTWKQAIWRSPGDRVPWWVLAWIKRSPLVFLVLSVASFSVGLVLFTFASEQHLAVCVVTTILTAVSCIGLASVSAWFASERWIFNRHQGTKWLLDSLHDVWMGIMSIYAISLLSDLALGLLGIVAIPLSGLTPRMHAVSVQIKSALLKLVSLAYAAGYKARNLVFRIPVCHAPGPRDAVSPQITGSGIITSPDHIVPILRSPSEGISRNGQTNGTGDYEKNPGTLALVDFRLDDESDTKNPPMSPAVTRFASVVRSVMMMNSAAQVEPRRTIDTSRAATLGEKLRSMVRTQDLAAHKGHVRHLRFSPNGKYLVSSSSDRMSYIFHVRDPLVHHRILAHPSGFVRGIEWSPAGNMLLTKLNTSIKVWTEAGVCIKTIERRRQVRSICWLPGGEVYNPEEKCIRSQLPIFHQMRAVTASRTDLFALVSYESQAPQLWRIDVVKNTSLTNITARPTLLSYYTPSASAEWSGPACFGGKNDELVLCASKSGDIYMWDRDSAALLHHINVPALGGNLTSLAWNPAADPFMFAIGSHSGALGVWTSPPPPVSPLNSIVIPPPRQSVLADGARVADAGGDTSAAQWSSARASATGGIDSGLTIAKFDMNCS
ncbi:hypothetical protein EWM64_g6675 [Hericium alpestre]|uniref:Molybdate-anion transporter n=1 Tax=Hericium alpestre TaxID=135208 RepID=A0A4Y9ZR24_9AGAM|nr:hypothetical protein EWM64_g6675 [Hericium alpestre]